MSLFVAALLVAYPSLPHAKYSVGCIDSQPEIYVEETEKNFTCIYDELNGYRKNYPLKDEISYVLSKFHKVHDQNEVELFLLRNEKLVSLINEALVVIHNCFPPDTQIVANILHNDFYGEKPQLYISMISDTKKNLTDELEIFDNTFGYERLLQSNELIFGV